MTFKEFLSQKDMVSLLETIEQKTLIKDKDVFPPKHLRYVALEMTPLDQIKVVILGQDPYHGAGQANGLAFSCLKTPLPPSLKNIFKAVEMQCGDVDGDNGDLTRWATQGVLLWNVYLSVQQGTPLSHAFEEYEQLTKALITYISTHQKHVVFMLWGKFAQSFETYIQGQHLILKTVHPSPLSVYRGFYEASVFLKANEYLLKHHRKEIDWT